MYMRTASCTPNATSISTASGDVGALDAGGGSAGFENGRACLRRNEIPSVADLLSGGGLTHRPARTEEAAAVLFNFDKRPRRAKDGTVRSTYIMKEQVSVLRNVVVLIFLWIFCFRSNALQPHVCTRGLMQGKKGSRG